MEDYGTLSTNRGMSFSARPLNFVARPQRSVEIDDRPDRSKERASLQAIVPEESLIVDDRSGLTPAQAVESKLMNVLRHASLSVSHLQMRGLVRGRCDS